ncbi:MAG: DUF2177 family protein [Pseudomonadota bacterium]
MTLLTAYVATAVAFLVIDMIGLRLLVLPIFNSEAGQLFRDDPRILPAAVFYLGFIAGVVWFVSAPALASGAGLGHVFLNAAFFGAIAYGTYEFTNLATLKGWTLRMALTDFVWGAALTAVSATVGVWIARMIAGGPPAA